MILTEYEKLLKASNLPLICEGMFGECGHKPAFEVACRTSYSISEMNVRPVLCEACERAYNEHWDDMWNEYWSDRL